MKHKILTSQYSYPNDMPRHIKDVHIEKTKEIIAHNLAKLMLEEDLINFTGDVKKYNNVIRGQVVAMNVFDYERMTKLINKMGDYVIYDIHNDEKISLKSLI